MKNTTRISMILTILFISTFGCNQKSVTDPESTTETWMRTYGGNESFSTDVLPADDGGYYIVGMTDVQWEPVMQGDVVLIRTDASGETLWQRTYGGDGFDTGQALIETSDGGLMIAGHTTSFGAQGMDVYLLKLDQEGNEIWSCVFGDSLNERMTAAHQTADEGYYLVGNVENPDDVIADAGAAGYGGLDGRCNIHLAKTDENGSVIWSRTMHSENNVIASSASPTADGGMLVSATIMYYPANDNDIVLLKSDGNGNETWSRAWEEDKRQTLDMIPSSDGNYLLAGAHAPTGTTDYFASDFHFMKVDPNGSELWTSTFGDPATIERASVIAQTSDGGYITAGGVADIILVKVDENGQRSWEHIIETGDGYSHNVYTSIMQHADGGYVIAGTTIGNTSRIFLIKTDADGDVNE